MESGANDNRNRRGNRGSKKRTRQKKTAATQHPVGNGRGGAPPHKADLCRLEDGNLVMVPAFQSATTDSCATFDNSSMEALRPLSAREYEPKKSCTLCCWTFSLSDQYVLLCVVGSFSLGYTISCLNTLEDPLSYLLSWCRDEDVSLHRAAVEELAADEAPTGDYQHDQLLLMRETLGLDHKCSRSSSRFLLLNVLVFLAAALGSLSGGMMSNFGRRYLNLHVHFAFCLGATMQAFAGHFVLLIIGRAFQGWAVGAVTVASPLFISEISPLAKRGNRGVLHQLAITIGILVGILPGIAFQDEDLSDPSYQMSRMKRELLRFVLGLPAIISACVICLMFVRYTSDTPHYLVRTRRFAEAHNLLQEIYGKEEVAQEIQDITRASSAMLKTELSDGSYGFKKLFQDWWYRRAFLAGAGLCFFQQITGINSLVSGSTTILEQAGMPKEHVSYASTALFVLNVLATFIPLFVVDSHGRRTLLVTGSCGQLFFLSLPLVYTLFSDQEPSAWILMVSLLCFMGFFAIATGPITWVYVHEIFPPEVQGVAVGVCSTVHWLMAITTVTVFSYFDSASLKFCLSAVAAGFSLVFCWYFLLETTGRSNGNSPYLEGRPADTQTDHLLADYHACMAPSAYERCEHVWYSSLENRRNWQ